MNLTSTGAVPVSATRFVCVVKLLGPLRAKGSLPCAPFSWLRMLARAVVMKDLMLVGAETVNPFAAKAADLASTTGPRLATSIGPVATSLNERQYARR